MSLFAIGIGGTGSKCLESLTQLASVGLLENNSQSIYTLFVDPDETNGNLERARISLSRHQDCYKLFEQGNRELPWMRTRLTPFGLWSPFSKITTDKQLSALFGYDSLKRSEPDLGNLFDVLFTPEEREATLDVGFRGRPAIGSAVMSQIDLDNLDEEVWRRLIERIQNDAGSGANPRIILFGSIFGGTGASGLPTIGRLLDQKLKDVNIREKVPIACVFMLPYFSFTPTGKMAANEVYARSDQFLMNTEAALRYYLSQSQPFNGVYLLGNQKPSEVAFSLGKQTQTNQPHFVELYAGLAARHFSNNPRAHEKVLVSLISRESSHRILWKDLPDTEEARVKLSNAARFAYAWLTNIEPELSRAREVGIGRFQKEAPWFTQFFQPASTGIIGRLINSGGELADFNAPEEQQAITTISEWCRDFLRWLGDIHQYRDESIELFRVDILTGVLAGSNSNNADELAQLVIGTELDRSRLSQDTLPNLKLKLDNPNMSDDWGKGATGLAKALYYLCKP
jgi:hypothetical protein